MSMSKISPQTSQIERRGEERREEERRAERYGEVKIAIQVIRLHLTIKSFCFVF